MPVFDGKTKVYLASVDVLSDPSLYEALYRTAPEMRRKKINALAVPADRRRSLGAWALLSEVLRRQGIFDPKIGLGQNGKPYLINGEACFNLSHSGDRVMCVLSSDAVGCDVEQIRPMDLNVARRFFTAEEYAFLRSHPSPEAQNEWFFRLWTLKESYMKATGSGLRLLPSRFEIIWQKGLPLPIDSETGKTFFFREYAPGDGYYCACCGAKDDLPEELIFVDLRFAAPSRL